MKRLTYILFLFVILLTGCRQRPDELDFMVLYTTETYGNPLPWNFNTDTTASTSLANFMSLVKEQRAIYGDRCIVLDNGNMHTRNLSNFFWRYIDTNCEPLTYKAQRFIGYDAVAMGHSDLRLREPFVAMRHDTTLCPPTICMNLYNQRTGKTFFRPWVCLERNGVRIVVFSVVDEDADNWTPRLGHPDARCHGMLSTLREQILYMRHQCNPDLVIGLISSPKYPDELQISDEIPGIDYLIGLRLSTDPTKRTNQYAGMVRFLLKRDARTDSYSKQVFHTSVDLSQYEADPEYCAYFADDIKRIRKEYNKTVGSLPEDIIIPYGIYSPHDYYRDLLNQAQLWYSGADVSLSNIANANVNEIVKAGPVTISRIPEIFVHENILVTFRVTGAELKNILESFYGMQYNRMGSASDKMIALRYDKKGHQRYNLKGQPYLQLPISHFTSGAGLRYTVDLSRSPRDRISIHSFNNGKKFHTDSIYTVCTNSYIASGFGNKAYIPYLDWEPNEMQRRIVNYDMPSITYVLYKYFLECEGAYTPSEVFDCDFVPNDWWRIAKQRELETLNPAP